MTDLSAIQKRVEKIERLHPPDTCTEDNCDTKFLLADRQQLLKRIERLEEALEHSREALRVHRAVVVTEVIKPPQPLDRYMENFDKHIHAILEGEGK